MLQSFVHIHKRVLLEVSQQCLVKYQHCSTLHACPYESWTNASKPTSNSFCLVYYLQARVNGRRVECCGAVGFECRRWPRCRNRSILGSVCGRRSRRRCVFRGRRGSDRDFRRVSRCVRKPRLLNLNACFHHIQRCGHNTCCSSSARRCCDLQQQTDVVRAHVALCQIPLFFVERELQCRERKVSP